MLLLGWLYWESAIDGVRAGLAAWAVMGTALAWLDSLGLQSLRTVLAPAIVVALAVPLVVVACLVLVALFLSPVMTRLVAARRFPALQARADGRLWRRKFHGLGHGLLAVLLMGISLPLWLLSAWAALLLPLIWSWLAFQVLPVDALARHASADERQRLLLVHRWPLLGMGLACGVLAALPLLMWTTGAAAFVLAPLLVLLSVWLHTWVFAFATAWFTHYLLAALHAHRSSVIGSNSG